MIAGLTAALLQTIGFSVIATAVLRGSSAPNPFSWFIWSVVASLAVANSWQAGATWPLASAATNALGCIVVFASALARGHFRPTCTGLACLGVATLGLAGWWFTADPVLALLFVLGADACAAIPTIRGTLMDPARESLAGWILLAAAGLKGVLSVEAGQWDLSPSAFGQSGAAVYVAAVNAAVVLAIVWGRMWRGRPATGATFAGSSD